MAEEILHKVDIGWLLGVYGAMLTDKQRELASLYFEEDYSLAEIAAQARVSRQSVYDTLQRVEKQLLAMEQKLGVREKLARLEEQIQQALTVLPDEPGCETARQHLEKALRLLNDEEEINGL